MNLDELLDRSAPRVAGRTPELRHELRMLVVKTDAVRRSRRRRRALLTGVGVVAAGIAGWGAADGAGLTGGRHFPWTDPAGSACTLSFVVGPVSGDPGSSNSPGDPRDVPKHINPIAQQKAVADARRFVASFSLDSVEEKQAVKVYRAVQKRNAARGLQPDPATGDDFVLASVGYLFGQELDSYLRTHGDTPSLVASSYSGGGDACFYDGPGGVGRG